MKEKLTERKTEIVRGRKREEREQSATKTKNKVFSDS